MNGSHITFTARCNTAKGRQGLFVCLFFVMTNQKPETSIVSDLLMMTWVKGNRLL